METVEQVEKSVDLEKKYSLPEKIKIISHKNKYLVIYSEAVLWLVLEDETELEIFKDLSKGFSILELLEKYDEENVINVITQIEAKDFEHPKVNLNTEETIYIYLTNRCNLRCRHCYMYAGDIDYKELTVSQWLKVIDDFKANGGAGITFTGGEVLVYEGYEKIIKHAHEIGLKVTILTNGILWTPEKIKELSVYIDEVQISIDGYDEASYNYVRNYFGFNKALECAKGFYDNNVRISIAVTPLYENIDSFVENFEPFAKKFLEEYPDIFIKINLELLKGREINISSEENSRYKEKLKGLVERLYPNYYAENFILNFENHEIRKNCGFGGISIAPDGGVFWCNRIHELKSSMNVLDKNFADILTKSSEVKNNTSVDNTKGCKECEVRYICGGGCRFDYEGIYDIDTHEGEWSYKCSRKNLIYDRMIESNEYFFEG